MVNISLVEGVVEMGRSLVVGSGAHGEEIWGRPGRTLTPPSRAPLQLQAVSAGTILQNSLFHG